MSPKLSSLPASCSRDGLRSLTAICGIILVCASAGCTPPGSGDGWVEGTLWIQNCRDGQPLDRTDGFDLGVDFFFGDPLFDTTDSIAERRSRVTLRIQETSNNIEETNGLLLEFQDLGQAAQAFVQHEPLPITDESLCPACTDINTALRFRLNLFATCPDNRASLEGVVQEMSDQQTPGAARTGQCLLPTPSTSPPAPCPQLSSDQLQELDALCASPDFNDRSHRDDITRLLGDSGACLYLCQLGDLARGDDPGSLRGYEIGFGDRIAALFSTNIEDTRAIRLNQCAAAQGHLTGMFTMVMVRSRVAQPFP